MTYRRIVLADLDRHCGSMIGTPIPDLCVEILDRFMQPVPIGISGEIYIGGAGVARVAISIDWTSPPSVSSSMRSRTTRPRDCIARATWRDDAPTVTWNISVAPITR